MEDMCATALDLWLAESSDDGGSIGIGVSVGVPLPRTELVSSSSALDIPHYWLKGTVGAGEI